MEKISLRIDNEFYTTCYADGILVSTTVGSSSYSMSAGGAIIDPRLQNVVQIVPVCPFAGLGIRPIIIPSSSVVEISLLRPRLAANLIIDGQFEIPVNLDPLVTTLTVEQAVINAIFGVDESREARLTYSQNGRILTGATTSFVWAGTTRPASFFDEETGEW